MINRLKRRKSTEYLQMVTNFWVHLIKKRTLLPAWLAYCCITWMNTLFSFLLWLLLPDFWLYLLMESIFFFSLFPIKSSSLPMLCLLSAIIIICWLRACINEWVSELMNELTDMIIAQARVTHPLRVRHLVCLWRHGSCSQVAHSRVRTKTWQETITRLNKHTGKREQPCLGT